MCSTLQKGWVFCRLEHIIGCLSVLLLLGHTACKSPRTLTSAFSGTSLLGLPIYVMHHRTWPLGDDCCWAWWCWCFCGRWKEAGQGAVTHDEGRASERLAMSLPGNGHWIRWPLRSQCPCLQLCFSWHWFTNRVPSGDIWMATVTTFFSTLLMPTLFLCSSVSLSLGFFWNHLSYTGTLMACFTFLSTNSLRMGSKKMFLMHIPGVSKKMEFRLILVNRQ